MKKGVRCQQMPKLGFQFLGKTADFAGAFERAQEVKTSALIEVRIDPDAISPRTTLSAIRAEALKNQSKA